MSFDIAVNDNVIVVSSFNPFGTGQCLSTNNAIRSIATGTFQSLWNRAMSFDGLELGKVVGNGTGFNPFGTGQCLSTTILDSAEPAVAFQSLWNRAMSFDLTSAICAQRYTRFNPFGTGQCLSTDFISEDVFNEWVSIPLEQGNVFRLTY